mmetsp:Transcript_7853/g.8650  ORF Transcript_7853/g.8650 Transcript_7853/m.8650 type:complete len:226 (-) Transcript_7853:69-746(-)
MNANNSHTSQAVAPSQAQAPPTTIEQATSEFRAGVTAVLRSWSALRTAVQSQWGGIESQAKAEYLRTYILDAFDYTKASSNPKLEINELEDNLAIYMEEEFSVALEDASERDVANIVWQMYHDCGKGNFDFARNIVLKSLQVTNNARQEKIVVKGADGESDNEDSDDEMMDTGTGATGSSSEFASQYLFGCPPGETISSAPKAPKEKVKPIVDDDGFTTVTKKGR